MEAQRTEGHAKVPMYPLQSDNEMNRISRQWSDKLQCYLPQT